METVEDGVRSMDIVSTAAVVTPMAHLYLIYHQLAVFLSGLSRIYLTITRNIANDLFGEMISILLEHPLSCMVRTSKSTAWERYLVTSFNIQDT